jgi:hypothetical protein
MPEDGRSRTRLPQLADRFEFGPKTSNDSGVVGAMMSIDRDGKLPRRIRERHGFGLASMHASAAFA